MLYFLKQLRHHLVLWKVLKILSHQRLSHRRMLWCHHQRIIIKRPQLNNLHTQMPCILATLNHPLNILFKAPQSLLHLLLDLLLLNLIRPWRTYAFLQQFLKLLFLTLSVKNYVPFLNVLYLLKVRNDLLGALRTAKFWGDWYALWRHEVRLSDEGFFHRRALKVH